MMNGQLFYFEFATRPRDDSSPLNDSLMGYFMAGESMVVYQELSDVFDAGLEQKEKEDSKDASSTSSASSG